MNVTGRVVEEPMLKGFDTFTDLKELSRVLKPLYSHLLEAFLDGISLLRTTWQFAPLKTVCFQQAYWLRAA